MVQRRQLRNKSHNIDQIERLTSPKRPTSSFELSAKQHSVRQKEKVIILCQWNRSKVDSTTSLLVILRVLYLSLSFTYHWKVKIINFENFEFVTSMLILSVVYLEALPWQFKITIYDLAYRELHSPQGRLNIVFFTKYSKPIFSILGFGSVWII